MKRVQLRSLRAQMARARGRRGVWELVGLLIAVVLSLASYLAGLVTVAYGLAITAVLAAVARMLLSVEDGEILSEARRQAETDDLTGLANRRLLLQRLEQAIGAADGQNRRLSLLILDLDDFKQLNDTLGHAAGDSLLGLIGPRLRGLCRRGDTLARLGGDEFALLLGDSCGDAGERVAREIQRALDHPFIVAGLSVRITGSIGIASYPEDGHDVEELLKHADIALYEAKTSRSGHARYVEARDTHSPERLAIAHELAEAIEHRELEVHFQPQADAAGLIVGAEALLRWPRRDGRRIAPNDFVAAANKAGLSRALTRLVLETSLDELVLWRAQDPELKVSVNTTVADLLDERFATEVEYALAARDLPAHALVLEVTETSILNDPVRIAKNLERLSALGVGLSLDDFGTGYSSLDHLRSLPVAEIKIDRSFVSAMTADRVDAAIVEATVLLAHQLGIRIVAEGVEDDLTWQRLTALGCELLQGYRLSRPVPAAAFRQLLAEDCAALAPARAV